MQKWLFLLQGKRCFMDQPTQNHCGVFQSTTVTLLYESLSALFDQDFKILTTLLTFALHSVLF